MYILNSINKYLLHKVCTATLVVTFPVLSFAQAQYTWGAGDGGYGGTLPGSSVGQGTAGQQGVGGDGGQTTGGEAGGAGGAYGRHVFQAETIDVVLHGGGGYDGGNASSIATSGGGGGGGGVGLLLYGAQGSTDVYLSDNAAISGGNGGRGGDGYNNAGTSEGGGGWGGNGGAGVYVEGINLWNRGEIFGAKGGRGGDGFGSGGSEGYGGAGGWAVVLDTNASLTNEGHVQGGDGGAYGATDVFWSDQTGVAGGGVFLLNDSTVFNKGTILAGEGNVFGSSGTHAIFAQGDRNRIVNEGDIESQRLTSVTFIGSDNQFEIHAGSSVSGDVEALGDRNVLVLGGDLNDSFNTSQIGGLQDDVKYRGFSSYVKSGSSKWELVGSTKEVTPWTISGGILEINSDNNLGDAAGILSMDGGALIISMGAFDPVEIYRPIYLTPNTGSVIYTDDDEAYVESIIYGPGSLQKVGFGTLILSNDNTYTGNTLVIEGKLQIGDGGASGSVKGIIYVDDDAELIFDRSDTYLVDNRIDGEGTLSFEGGTAVLTEDNYSFDGKTNIVEGQLRLSGKLGGFIEIGPDTIMSGDGTAEHVLNRGVLAPGNTTGYGSLIITDYYMGGPGSVIHINAALGDDNSAADKLIIEGDAEGEGAVRIENRGSGGQTDKGIEIISIGGISDASFNLIGDYNLSSGTPAVIAGAHSYVLVKGSEDPLDGNWYLRSNLKDVVCSPDDPDSCYVCEDDCPVCEECGEPSVIYQPGVPVYSGLASVVHRLNDLSGMFGRVADRYWRGSGARHVVEGDGPGMLEAAPDPTRHEFVTDAGLVWGRIEAAHTNANLYGSSTDNHYESDTWKIRTGIDSQFFESEQGRLIGSAWLEYSNARADVLSFFGDGRIDVNGYAFGTSLTWLADSGLYIDAQVQALWTRSDISSVTLNQSLASDVKGKGYALSIEAGQAYAINNEWSLIPNGQLVWSHSNIDSFVDPFDAIVAFDSQRTLTARAGARLQHETSWLDSDGFMNRGKLYGSAQFSRELLGRNAAMLVSAEDIQLGHEGRSWGEIGLGGVYNFRNDKYSAYGELGLSGYLSDPAENNSVRGNLGLRVKW